MTSPEQHQIRSELVEVGLVLHAQVVDAICQSTRSRGELLICHGCNDVEALIAGFIIIAEDEEAWALCGTCLRKLPVFGAVV